MTAGQKEQWSGLQENASALLGDPPNDGRTCLWLRSTSCIRSWQRVWNNGMSLAYVTMLDADHHHGRRLREREMIGGFAVARTTSEDEPSKYPSIQVRNCFNLTRSVDTAKKRGLVILLTIISITHIKCRISKPRSGSLH